MLMKGRIIILNNKEQIYKKQEKLYIYEYQNAIILPRKYEDDGPTWGKGGVCRQEGEFVQSSFYDGGWAQNGGKYEWNQTDEIYIDEKVIYIGVFAKHWGHFLVDMTSKLWIFADPDIMQKIQVDRGAIRFVLSGANIMCPGLTSPGGVLDDEVEAETPVVCSIFFLITFGPRSDIS